MAKKALGRGLRQAMLSVGELPEMTIYCPDEAVAAMVCRRQTGRRYRRPNSGDI